MFDLGVDESHNLGPAFDVKAAGGVREVVLHVDDDQADVGAVGRRGFTRIRHRFASALGARSTRPAPPFRSPRDLCTR